MTNTEDARLRALACSSQPAAVSNVESSTAASAPTALCDDAQACKKRMRQRTTQHKREKSNSEEKAPLKTQPKMGKRSGGGRRDEDEEEEEMEQKMEQKAMDE